jgi:hypothetical protein
MYQIRLILACWFWRRSFLKMFSACIFTLLLFIPPLREGQSPSFKETWRPFPQGWFILSLVKISPVVMEKKIFIWPHPHFYIFVIISPLKRTWPFIRTKLNFLYPRIICFKFNWIWSAGSGEEDSLKMSMCFYSFISPWKRLSPSIE